MEFVHMIQNMERLFINSENNPMIRNGNTELRCLCSRVAS